jgi:epoxide hydrolase-like predicted phosphatase
MTIKAIIFDLGGVLLRTTDFSQRELLAARLGMTRPELEELIFWGESGSKAQRGEISVKQHLEYVRSVLKLSQEKFKEVIDIFFAEDALDNDLVDYIRSLHRTYKTGLLSNAANDLRKQIAEKWHFEDAFDTLVISGEVGMVKPEPQIYRLALERLGVEASEAVFVDDVQPNVEAAIRVGMQGIHFRDAPQVQQDLVALLAGQ